MSTAKGVRSVGFLSALAGALFVPYALSKGALTSSIIAGGWQLPGLSPAGSANLVHVLEGLPVLVMMAGVMALNARIDVQGRPSSAGIAAILTGFALTIVTHFGEHLLAPMTVPWLTGGENWFMWGYYLSWLVVYAGFVLYGLALLGRPDTPRWLPLLFVSALPVVLVVGIAVIMVNAFTVAGTFRVAQGLMWVVVGRWLWMGTGGSLAPTGRGLVVERNVGER